MKPAFHIFGIPVYIDPAVPPQPGYIILTDEQAQKAQEALGLDNLPGLSFVDDDEPLKRLPGHDKIVYELKVRFGEDE